MLKHRIIPVLLLRHGRCVKGKRFGEFRDTGAPVTAARIYDAQRVDELVFLDVLASREERDILFDIVTRTAEQCFMPLTVGGGIRTIEDIRACLAAGADKVAVNTAALERPEFIREAAEHFGEANIVVAIDYRTHPDGRREVFSHAGTEATGRDPIEWAREAADLGAGEVLLTSIDREGTMEGYDLDGIREVVAAVDIPVIAHGGVGTLEHLKEGVAEGHASGVAAASIFHFTDQNPIKARYHLTVHGINVRA